MTSAQFPFLWARGKESIMTADELLFFERTPKALALYEALLKEVMCLFPTSSAAVQKTQITFRDPGVFLCVSAPPGAKSAYPEGALNVTFGLPSPTASPRVFSSVEIRPGRWTHHLLLCGQNEIDPELLTFIAASHALIRKR